MCYAKYHEKIFANSLEDKKEYNYHKLVLGYADLMGAFERDFGTKVMLPLREKGTINNLRMFHRIF